MRLKNAEILAEYLEKSAKKKTYLAKKMGISRPTLDVILSNPLKATYFQAKVLCMELEITKTKDIEAIFSPIQLAKGD